MFVASAAGLLARSDTQERPNCQEARRALAEALQMKAAASKNDQEQTAYWTPSNQSWMTKASRTLPLEGFLMAVAFSRKAPFDCSRRKPSDGLRPTSDGLQPRLLAISSNGLQLSSILASIRPGAPVRSVLLFASLASFVSTSPGRGRSAPAGRDRLVRSSGAWHGGEGRPRQARTLRARVMRRRVRR